jgi:hypothetical protein
VTREAVAAFADGRLNADQLLAGAAPRKRAPAKKKAADKKKKR